MFPPISISASVALQRNRTFGIDRLATMPPRRPKAKAEPASAGDATTHAEPASAVATTTHAEHASAGATTTEPKKATLDKFFGGGNRSVVLQAAVQGPPIDTSASVSGAPGSAQCVDCKLWKQILGVDGKKNMVATGRKKAPSNAMCATDGHRECMVLKRQNQSCTSRG